MDTRYEIVRFKPEVGGSFRGAVIDEDCFAAWHWHRCQERLERSPPGRTFCHPRDFNSGTVAHYPG